MSEWISIKDRLPEKDMLYVLVANVDGPMSDCICSMYSHKDKEFYNIYGALKLTVDPVTHWMPLPEPPK